MVRVTRKASRKVSVPRLSGTFHGLNKWHKALFEKLGWMVLADAKGYHSKIAEYKKSIDHFLETAKHVSSEYESSNRKHDIAVLIMNMEALKAHVSKDF